MITWMRVVKVGAIALLAGVIVLAFSSWGRPMGIDEVLHFALGALSPSEALSAIHSSTGPNVNHGQTGFLMFINYLLLSTGGASLAALRLPSLVAAVIMLLCAVFFLRRQSLTWIWQIVLLLAFAGQAGLMFFAGEGRPYMLLVSTTVATLAYLQVSPDERRRWPYLLLGIFAIVVGFANHPYYPLMYVAVLAFTLFSVSLRGGTPPTWVTIRKAADLPLVGVGLVIYFVFGALTWMRGTPVFNFDPWGPVGDPVTAGKVLVASHAELLGSLPEVKIFVIALLVITALMIYGNAAAKSLLPPVALMGVGVVTSVVFSAASYLRDYWILPRQWVAGIALVTIGLVWLIAELFNMSRIKSSFFLSFVALGLSVYISLLGVASIAASLSEMRSNAEFWAAVRGEPQSAQELAESAGTNLDWEKAANVNVHEGGPVARGFKSFYRN